LKMKLELYGRPNQNQVIEIGQSVMEEPVLGWENEEVMLDGTYGKYYFRVDVERETITILQIEEHPYH